MIQAIKDDIKTSVMLGLNNPDINVVVEEPKRGNADLAIPLFGLVKQLGMSMAELSSKVSAILEDNPSISETQFLNGFLNISIDRVRLSKEVIEEVLTEKEKFGNDTINQTVCIDYSAPNIAKSFSIGHLRSTMIGNALKNIYTKLGYKVIGINHLGDWGTQFGKMIVAYKLWGDRKLIEQNPITELQKLYVKFHQESESNPSLEDDARAIFKRLEDGDQEMLELWQYFRDESLKEFMSMYDLLGVSFDSYDGESFYNDKMEAIADRLDELGLLVEDDGAMIVRLGDQIPPALIKRRDGATLYITRDLAALMYRYNHYHFDKVLYVVGNEQKLHFEQLKAVTKLMGHDFDIEHVNFGLVLQDGKKMSTRGGNVVKLYDVIKEAIEQALNAITLKNPNISNKEMVAKAVGIGAVIFNDLKNDRNSEIEFNLDQMLAFEGQTGPYLQYSSVRIASILKNQTLSEISNYDIFNEPLYFELVKLLASFNQTLKKATEVNGPHVISRYLLQLSQTFNQFYGQHKIITEDEAVKQANLHLILAVRTVLNEGLRLLGMTALDEM
ncbi:arginyl-tRNA synthetase [Acholeplasma morum]|uniref:arginine--tRNA ligase n=1 Tax=Paracholeplasma morum TaxID=264637 RepID=UPI00195C1C14|nr:arginine--tRNA ligase [Paracholeplasma morum]MBM7453865.1 arginyl-tRNA synthetase [Paracholeplasma morum]